jgi:hypothetical protein
VKRIEGGSVSAREGCSRVCQKENPYIVILNKDGIRFTERRIQLGKNLLRIHDVLGSNLCPICA